MITLENYVLEQNINGCDIYDIFIEQALSEIEVSCSLIDAYAKQEAIMEYCTDNNIDAHVILEADETDTSDESANASTKKGPGILSKIGNAIGKAFDAIITCFRMLYAKLTKVPFKTLEKKLDSLGSLGNKHNTLVGNDKDHYKMPMLKVDENIARDFEKFCKQPFLDSNVYQLLLKTGYPTEENIENFLRDTESVNDISQERNYNAEKSITIIQFREMFLDPLETYTVDKKIDAVVKKCQKYTKELAKTEGISAQNAQRISSRLKQITFTSTMFISEYTKLVNKLITAGTASEKDAYKADKNVIKQAEKESKKAEKAANKAKKTTKKQLDSSEVDDDDVLDNQTAEE